MEFIQQHLDAIIVILIVAIGVCIYAFKFASLSKEEKYKQIKAWLLQAVLFAEKEFGGKTGQLKLSYVYDMFCKTLPWLAKIIPFSLFSEFVDRVLEEARELLETNKQIAQFVQSGEVSLVEEVNK